MTCTYKQCKFESKKCLSDYYGSGRQSYKDPTIEIYVSRVVNISNLRS